jgi:hypothetical protein
VAHEGKGGDGSAGQIPTADGALGARESYGEVWPRKAVHGFGGSGVDERGKGRTGTGRWLAFILKEIGSVARAERGKRGGGVDMGASAWRREEERGALA